MKSVGREGEEQQLGRGGGGGGGGGGGNAESLKLLDAACLCSICHSEFDGPLLLRGCGHSFCSACIRQSLDFQEKSNSGPNCPTCRSPCDARDLVPNVALREVVYHFAACKQHLLAECEVEKQQKSGPTTRSRSRQTQAGAEKSKEKETHDRASPSSLRFWEDEDDENDEEWDEEDDEGEGDEGDELSPVKKKPRLQKEANSSHVSFDGWQHHS